MRENLSLNVFIVLNRTYAFGWKKHKYSMSISFLPYLTSDLTKIDFGCWTQTFLLSISGRLEALDPKKFKFAMNCKSEDDPDCAEKIKKYIEDMKTRDDIKIHVEDYPKESLKRKHSEL